MSNRDWKMREFILLVCVLMIAQIGIAQQSVPLQSISKFIGLWTFNQGEEFLNISLGAEGVVVEFRAQSDGFEQRFFDECQIRNGAIRGNFLGGVENVTIEFDELRNELLLSISPFHTFSPIVNQKFESVSPNLLKYVNSKTALNVRSAPSLDAKVIDQVGSGMRVEVLSTDTITYKIGSEDYCCFGQFSKIHFGNLKDEITGGYVFNYYLSDNKSIFLSAKLNSSEQFILDVLNQANLNPDSLKLTYTSFYSIEEYLNPMGINKDVFELLQLGRIGPYFEEAKVKVPDEEFYELQYSVNGTVDLSPNFYSIVVGYDYYNEYEAYLINYDLNGKLIDYIQVKYDDTVESFTPMYESYAEGQVFVSSYLISDQTDQYENPSYEKTKVQVYKVNDKGYFESVYFNW